MTDRQRQMEIEMNRFEQEIAHASIPRPMLSSSHALRFIPHAVHPPPPPAQLIPPPPMLFPPPPMLPPPMLPPMPLPSNIQEVAGSSAAGASGVPGKKYKRSTNKAFLRTAGGSTWEDTTLAEWDSNDFRLFCGDLGNEVSDELLAKAFRKYPSFQKAKVIREKRSNKTKGYGFVSFKDPQDFMRAMREMDGKYVGNRPIKLRKSTWKDRSFESVKKKTKDKKKLGLKI